MSRGPGRWQRVIIEALDQAGGEVVIVNWACFEHLGREPSRAELVAIRRSVKLLAEQSALKAAFFGCVDAQGNRRQMLGVVPKDSELAGTLISDPPPPWHMPNPPSSGWLPNR